MNREEIEYLKELIKTHKGSIAFYESLGVTTKNKQKQQSGIKHNKDRIKLIEGIIEQLQQKTITEEEIEKECWERYNLNPPSNINPFSPFWRGKREGFKECAEWIIEKLK